MRDLQPARSRPRGDHLVEHEHEHEHEYEYEYEYEY
jgi:hypothetical protein